MSYWVNRLRTLVASGKKPTGSGWDLIKFDEYLLFKNCGWVIWRPIDLEKKCKEKGARYSKHLIISPNEEVHRCIERCLLWNGFTPIELSVWMWGWTDEH